MNRLSDNSAHQKIGYLSSASSNPMSQSYSNKTQVKRKVFAKKNKGGTIDFIEKHCKH